MKDTNKILSIVIALSLTIIAVGSANGKVNMQTIGSILYAVFILTLIVKFGLWVVNTLKRSIDKIMKF